MKTTYTKKNTTQMIRTTSTPFHKHGEYRVAHWLRHLPSQSQRWASKSTTRRIGCRRLEAQNKPPSHISGGSELNLLSSSSQLVWVGPEEDFKGTGSSAAAVTSRILLKILRDPVGMRQFEQAIESALAYVETAKPEEKSNLPHCSLDKAMVNVGALLAEEVEGRVSTEVDARLSHDKDLIIEQVMYLSKLYKEVGVDDDKLLYRIPATWAGIQAAKVLEERGKSILMTLVCSFAQCVACAEAKVSVVQLYVGRVRDWHRSHPNAIKDPNGPREDSGFQSDHNPGLDLVKKCYNYLHKYHSGTKIMAGDIRSKKDALALAGCDYIVLHQKIIKELARAPSALGYNDGLSATRDYPMNFEPLLTPENAEKEFGEYEPVNYLSQDERSFNESLGACGTDLLSESLKRYCDSMDQLEPYFTKIAVSNL